jgi:ATP-dependent Clp protease adaptor protein ClpS
MASDPDGPAGSGLKGSGSTGSGSTDFGLAESGPVTSASLGSGPVGSGSGAGGGQPPADPRIERERDLATRTRPRARRPQRFKVLLFNDDFTPMEFVVAVLERIFGKGPAEATQLMLQIHRSGMGVAGVYVLEVAETKVAAVHRAAEERGYPLRAGVEKE